MLSTTWEIIDMVADRLEEKSGPLGLAFVGKYDEKRIPKYPAAVIIPSGRDKELHATNTFQLIIILDIYVYHSDLTLTKRERSKADLRLVADIEDELENDYEWRSSPADPNTKRLIFAYISREEPGVLQPRANKTNMVIGTRMTWRALTQRRF